MSIYFDFAPLLSLAGDLINRLGLVFMLPLGIILGLGLIVWIVRGIRSGIS